MRAPLPELIEHRRDEIRRLAERHHVTRLELFGSAATGEFDPASSDLDFIVRFGELPADEHADAYFGLLEGLEHLLGRPIDLLEDGAIRNKFLREAIDDSKRSLYEAA